MGEERWEVSVWVSHRQGNRCSCTTHYSSFFLLSAFQLNAAVSFSTMLSKLPTQKVSGSCAACNQSRRCYFGIIEARAGNYPAERLQSPTSFCSLAVYVISFLTNFSFYYSEFSITAILTLENFSFPSLLQVMLQKGKKTLQKTAHLALCLQPATLIFIAYTGKSYIHVELDRQNRPSNCAFHWFLPVSKTGLHIEICTNSKTHYNSLCDIIQGDFQNSISLFFLLYASKK